MSAVANGHQERNLVPHIAWDEAGRDYALFDF